MHGFDLLFFSLSFLSYDVLLWCFPYIFHSQHFTKHARFPFLWFLSFVSFSEKFLALPASIYFICYCIFMSSVNYLLTVKYLIQKKSSCLSTLSHKRRLTFSPFVLFLKISLQKKEFYVTVPSFSMDTLQLLLMC